MTQQDDLFSRDGLAGSARGLIALRLACVDFESCRSSERLRDVFWMPKLVVNDDRGERRSMDTRETYARPTGDNRR